MNKRGYASVISLLFLVAFSMSATMLLTKQMNSKLALNLSKENLEIDQQYKKYRQTISKINTQSKAKTCSQIKTNHVFELEYRCISQEDLLKSAPANLVSSSQFAELKKTYWDAKELSEGETNYYMVYISDKQKIQEIRILNQQNKSIYYAYYE